jgi:hypothetical protein
MDEEAEVAAKFHEFMYTQTPTEKLLSVGLSVIVTEEVVFCKYTDDTNFLEEEMKYT